MSFYIVHSQVDYNPHNLTSTPMDVEPTESNTNPNEDLPLPMDRNEEMEVFPKSTPPLNIRIYRSVIEKFFQKENDPSQYPLFEDQREIFSIPPQPLLFQLPTEVSDQELSDIGELDLSQFSDRV